jgi:glycogen synthase
MRILMTADTVGGVWTYALEVADALAPHGVEVHLATMGPLPDDDQRAAARAGAVAAVHGSGYALEWEDDPWEDVDRAGDWLVGLAREVRPDVVHLNGYAHAPLDWPAPVLVAAHSDVISWWRAVERTSVPPWLTTYRERVTAGLRAADAVCAPTQSVLDDLAANYAFHGPGSVVPNGRAPFGVFRAKEALVAGLGRFWDQAKNVSALERVADRLPWPVTVAGPGTAAGRLSQAQAAALLARASIFASPARYEPFGQTILEAALSECALVLGDVPSLRELWGGVAVFVPPDDSAALREVLAALIDHETLRRTLGHRARRRGLTFSAERMGDAYVSLYQRLLAGGRQARAREELPACAS